MITISSLHNQARLEGTRTFIDAGAGVAKFALYSTARVLIDEAPLSAAIVEIPLAEPCGTVSAAGLALEQSEDGLIMTTGAVLWARLVNGNGDTVADFTIRADADAPESGELSMPTTTLYAGGAARLTTATLT